MGVANGPQPADNHQTLNNTAPTVANFRCSSPGVNDVWMKDLWNDTGLEPDPNTAGQSMSKSPYIWIRNDQDAELVNQHRHQNPIFRADQLDLRQTAQWRRGGGQRQSGALLRAGFHRSELAGGLDVIDDHPGQRLRRAFDTHRRSAVGQPAGSRSLLCWRDGIQPAIR